MRRLVLATLALFACSELEPLELDSCGNGVWEPMAGEDCDTNTNEGQCGPAGTAGACRYVCATSDDCPDGRRCGDDGICRLPIRRFVAAPGSPYPSVGNQLAVADLDGDDDLDLIGSDARGANVLFGDGRGGLGDRRSLITGTPLARAMQARVPRAGPQRLVTPMRAGVQVNIVDEQRDLFAVANTELPFDLRERVRLVRVPSDRVQDILAVFVQIAGTLRLTTFGVDAVPLEVAGNITALRAPATGDVDGDGTDELAVTFDGESDVRVLQLECIGGGRVTACTTMLRWRLLTTVAFGAVVETMAFADFDADSRIDLFAATEAGVRVARGTGNQAFAAATPDPRLPCGTDCTVLAVEDIDADGRADYVLDDRLLTTSTAAATAKHSASAGDLDGWSYAATGDFDGDGRRDLAVAQSERFGIEIAYGAEAPLYNAFFEQTPEPVAGLVAADFDGDGVDDLAAVLNGLDDAAIVVLYGRADGFSEPVQMGRFPSVRRMIPAFLAGLSPDSQDVRTDLLVETTDPTTDEERVVVLIATPEHQMVSPILLSATPMMPAPALAVATGTFVRTSEYDDLLVLTEDRVVRIPTNELGDFDTELALTATQDLVRGATSRRLIETVQLDDDAFDEVLVVTGAHPNPTDDPPGLVVIDVDAEGDVSVVEVNLPAQVFSPSSVRIAALPPFGERVVIMAFTGGDESGVALLPVGADGAISDDAVVLLAEDGRKILSAEVANIDSDEISELIALSRTDVTSIEVRDGALVWGPPVPLGDTLRPPSAFSTMRATDLDRDGLVDLAIGNEFGLYVYRALERQELAR